MLRKSFRYLYWNNFIFDDYGLISYNYFNGSKVLFASKVIKYLKCNLFI